MTHDSKPSLYNLSEKNHQKDDIINIRSRLLNTSIIVTLLFSIPGYLSSVFRFEITGIKPLIVFHSFSIIVLGVFAVFRDRISFRLRVISVLILWLFIGWAGIFTWGLIGMGLPWLIVLCLWASAISGIRYGILMAILSCFMIGGVGVGGFTDTIRFDFNVSEYSTAASAWLHAFFTFAFQCTIVIICLKYLNSLLAYLTGQSKDQIAALVKAERIIDEKKNTETKLEAGLREKTTILNVMSEVSIACIDTEMKIIWSNDFFKSQYGKETFGMKCHSIHYGLSEPCHNCIATNALNMIEPYSGEINDGDRTHLLQCLPVKNGDNEIIGCVIASTDISSQRHIEYELTQVRLELERLVEERTIEFAEANEALENAVINANKMATESAVRNQLLAKEMKKREQVESALKNSEQRYRAMIESIEEGYFEMDLNGRFIFYNKAFCHIGGYTAKDLESKTGKDLLAPGNMTDVINSYSEVVRTGDNRTDYCYDVVRKDGSTITVEVSISGMLDINGRTTGFRGLLRDVDARKRYEENLVYLAYHDALTSLENRKAFYERVAEIIHQAQRNNNEMALAFIDIDKFKEVNDTLGHEAGDDLLKAISERLTKELRKTDYVFRLGGDEFTIIFSQSENIQLDIILQKIVNCLASPYCLDTAEINYVTASIGISIFPHDGSDSESLIRNADLAMYKAKEVGNLYVRFSKMNTG